MPRRPDLSSGGNGVPPPRPKPLRRAKARPSGRKGFTLIELMIVLAVIAVVATIAIPNLVTSKIASNETAAVAALRTCLSAQNLFRRTDFYDQGFLEHANTVRGSGFPDLYQVGGPGGVGAVLKLIDITVARAKVGGPPRSGYVFDDMEYGDYSMDCGLGAAPAKFDRSGRNVFVVDVTGTVYQGQGSEGCLPPTQYPDVSSDWIPVGSEG